jgi:hypothetical protein
MKTDAIPSVAILFKKIATPDLIKKSSAAKGFLHCAFPVREGGRNAAGMHWSTKLGH